MSVSAFSHARDTNVQGGEFYGVQGDQYRIYGSTMYFSLPENINEKLKEKLKPDLNAHISSNKFCLKGTRQDIIKEISDWVLDNRNNTPQLFFLYGPAGTGKSAIAHTIGEKFKDMNCLGGFFCFNRTFAAERTPSRALQSIAYNLALYVENFGQELAKILEDPYILQDSNDMEKQWKNLIVKPAHTLNRSLPVLIIIDALDECAVQQDKGPSERLISLLLEKVYDLPKNFYVMVTSRPEGYVADYLKAKKNASGLWTKDMSSLKGTREDIYTYVYDKMKIFIDQGNFTMKQCEIIAEGSEGFFQWAYTVCAELFGKPKPGVRVKKHLEKQLEILLSVSHVNAHLQPLDQLYKTILQGIFDSNDGDIMREYRKVMSHVLAEFEPLAQSSLERLESAYFEWTGKEEDEQGVDLVIPFLGSLLTGVDELNTPVRPIHTSIHDFLVDESRSGEYAIKLSQGHIINAIGGIKIMTNELHFNMCDLENSHLRNSEVTNLLEKIAKGISLDVQYACKFWGSHLIHTEVDQSVLSLIEQFLWEFSLYWMEVLSVLQQIDNIPRNIEYMIKWIYRSKILLDSHLVETIGQEIRQFVQVFGQVLVNSTPHMYLSALPFIPRDSILQKAYVSHFKKLAVLCSGHKRKWPYSQARLQGHTDIVRSVAFSPDGRRIVSGSDDKSVKIWNAETGQAEGVPLLGHTYSVTCVAFSSDGNRIVSGSVDKSVRIWNSETGQANGIPLQGHTNNVLSLSFSPDARRIVSGSSDRSIRIWNADTGQAEGVPLLGHTNSVCSVAFSPDGKRIASGSKDCSLRIWSAETGQPQGRPLQGHTNIVRSVAFSPDGKRIASGSEDHSLRVWSAEFGQPQRHSMQEYPLSVLSVAFSPDGKRIVSGLGDQSVRIWNVETGQAEGMPLQGHTAAVWSVAFSPDGKRIASGSQDKSIRIWNTGTAGPEAAEVARQGHTRSVTSVAFSPDGKKIVSGSWDLSVRIWNANTGKAEEMPLQGHSNSVLSVAFSPDGKSIVSGSQDESVKIWSAETGQAKGMPLQGHIDSVYTVAFSPDGKRLVSGSVDKSLRIWNAETRQPEGVRLLGHTDSVWSVSFSPDGNRIVSGSQDHSVRIWNVETTWFEGYVLHKHTAPILSVAFSSDGQKIVFGSDDKSINIWNVKTRKPMGMPLHGHTESIRSVAFSPDGKRIVSGSDDHSVRIWNVETGQPEGVPLQGHTGGVWSVAFSPDGKQIVSGSQDHSLRIWNAEVVQGHTGTMFSLSFCPLHSGHHHIHTYPALQTISYTPNGWICGSDSSLFLWIPSAWRNAISFPHMQFLLSTEHLTSFDLSNFVHGRDWNKCYTG